MDDEIVDGYIAVNPESMDGRFLCCSPESEIYATKKECLKVIRSLRKEYENPKISLGKVVYIKS